MSAYKDGTNYNANTWSKEAYSNSIFDNLSQRLISFLYETAIIVHITWGSYAHLSSELNIEVLSATTILVLNDAYSGGNTGITKEIRNSGDSCRIDNSEPINGRTSFLIQQRLQYGQE